MEHETQNTKLETKNIMKQSQMNEHTAQFSTQPSCGRGSKKYRKPSIEIIFLDNDISLALESSPPLGPDETFNNFDMNGFKNNPYKTSV